jgi:hypothetical protein
MANLTPQEYADLIRKLDDVCKKAQELAQVLREQMVQRARRDLEVASRVAPARRGTIRKKS